MIRVTLFLFSFFKKESDQALGNLTAFDTIAKSLSKLTKENNESAIQHNAAPSNNDIIQVLIGTINSKI